MSRDAGEDDWRGHRNPDWHRTVGSHRAWCDCGEWCYPSVDLACSCCLRQMAEEHPCPCCDGTGIAGGDPDA